MSGPQRIKVRRAKGWRMPPGANVVDRSTAYGNPFTVENALRRGVASTEVEARLVVVAEHRAWLDGKGEDTYTVGRRTFDRRLVLATLHLLAGRDPACTCSLPEAGEPDVCHAVTLLELANGGAA